MIREYENYGLSMIIQKIVLVMKILFIYLLDGNYTKFLSLIYAIWFVCFINETLTGMQVDLFKNEIQKGLEAV